MRIWLTHYGVSLKIKRVRPHKYQSLPFATLYHLGVDIVTLHQELEPRINVPLQSYQCDTHRENMMSLVTFRNRVPKGLEKGPYVIKCMWNNVVVNVYIVA